MKNYKEYDKQYIVPTYNRADILITKGKGSICYDDYNNEYIDLGSGLGVNIFGYSDDDWVSAITAQATKLSHTSNLYYSEPCIDLAKILCDKTGYDKVFFSNSGAEANEAAIKIARKYSYDKYGDNRHNIITLTGSFHGRTMATISATGQDKFHTLFHPFLDGFDYVKVNDVDDLISKVDDKTCAFMLEFIQGEGGVVTLEPDFVTQIARLCKQKDILIIADEVQSGIGRVGTFLASEYFDIKPNITTLAKGLGGGLPIGALLCDNITANVLSFGTHGSTFGANPITCAGAYNVVSRLNNDFLQQVIDKGNFIREKLSPCKGIKSISGLGMMIGIKLKEKTASNVLADALKAGVIVLTAQDKIRLLPPLNISYAHLEKALDILIKIIES